MLNLCRQYAKGPTMTESAARWRRLEVSAGRYQPNQEGWAEYLDRLAGVLAKRLSR